MYRPRGVRYSNKGAAKNQGTRASSSDRQAGLQVPSEVKPLKESNRRKPEIKITQLPVGGLKFDLLAEEIEEMNTRLEGNLIGAALQNLRIFKEIDLVDFISINYRKDDSLKMINIDPDNKAVMATLRLKDSTEVYVIYHAGQLLIKDKESAEGYWAEKKLQNNRVTTERNVEEFLGSFTFNEAAERLGLVLNDTSFDAAKAQKELKQNPRGFFEERAVLFIRKMDFGRFRKRVVLKLLGHCEEAMLMQVKSVDGGKFTVYITYNTTENTWKAYADQESAEGAAQKTHVQDWVQELAPQKSYLERLKEAATIRSLFPPSLDFRSQIARVERDPEESFAKVIVPRLLNAISQKVSTKGFKCKMREYIHSTEDGERYMIIEVTTRGDTSILSDTT